MNKGERIKKAREKCGISQTELAKLIGISKQNLYKYENSIITNIPSDKIEAIADKLGTTPAYLMGWDTPDIDTYEYDNISSITKKKFPMLGEIACGQPIFANEEYETFIEASSNIKADFCLTAKGDSMINARIFDGDIVFIKSQSDVDNGDIAAVIIDNEATLKRVYKYPNRLELRAENPLYIPLNYEEDQLEKIHIIGKAVAFMSYVK